MSTKKPDWHSHLARLAHIKEAEISLNEAAEFFLEGDDASAVKMLMGAAGYVGQAMGFETFDELWEHVCRERELAKARRGE